VLKGGARFDFPVLFLAPSSAASLFADFAPGRRPDARGFVYFDEVLWAFSVTPSLFPLGAAGGVSFLTRSFSPPPCLYDTYSMVGLLSPVVDLFEGILPIPSFFSPESSESVSLAPFSWW